MSKAPGSKWSSISITTRPEEDPFIVTAVLRVIWAIIWRTVLFFLAFALISAAFIVPVAGRIPEWNQTSPVATQLYADGAGFIAMVASTWLMTRFVDRRPFLSIGLAPGKALREMVIGIAIGAGWLSLSIVSTLVAGWATVQLSGTFSGIVLSSSAVSTFLNVLTQQLLLCGFILQTIEKRTNFGVALLISAALFSAYHAGAFRGEWLPAINVFAAGCLFCLAYRVTRKLWLPVGIHFTWNYLLGSVLGLTVSGTDGMGDGWSIVTVEGPALFTGGEFGLEGGLIVTLTTALCTVAVLLSWLRRPREPDAVGATEAS